MVYVLGNCPICGTPISKAVNDDIARIMEEQARGKEADFITVFDCPVCKEKMKSGECLFQEPWNCREIERWYYDIKRFT